MLNYWLVLPVVCSILPPRIRIAETVKSLLKETIASESQLTNTQEVTPLPLVRIALNVITHHYDDLKRLFWEWDGNPLEEYELKPEALPVNRNLLPSF